MHGADDASVTRSIREGWPDAGMPASEAPLRRGGRALVIFIREKVDEAKRAAPSTRSLRATRS